MGSMPRPRWGRLFPKLNSNACSDISTSAIKRRPKHSAAARPRGELAEGSSSSQPSSAMCITRCGSHEKKSLDQSSARFPSMILPVPITKGNDSPFGLAAGVWTRDIRKGHQAAAALEAGTVWVNCYNAFDNACPWGGFKQSGWGREKGPYGLDLFTQTKSVIINFT